MAIEFKPSPSLPPPSNAVGPVAWIRKNFFSSPLNIILTVVSIYVVYWIISHIAPWALGGIWNAGSLSECREIRDATVGPEHGVACWAVLKPIFAEKTTAEWLQILEAHGVPAGPIYTVDEMFGDPQVRHTGIVQSVDHYARGETQLVGQPINLSRTPAALDTAAPDAGEHSDEVLTGLGISADEIAALREAGVI